MQNDQDISTELAWIKDYSEGIQSLCTAGSSELPVTHDQLYAIMDPLVTRSERAYQRHVNPRR